MNPMEPRAKRPRAGAAASITEGEPPSTGASSARGGPTLRRVNIDSAMNTIPAAPTSRIVDRHPRPITTTSGASSLPMSPAKFTVPTAALWPSSR